MLRVRSKRAELVRRFHPGHGPRSFTGRRTILAAGKRRRPEVPFRAFMRASDG